MGDINKRRSKRYSCAVPVDGKKGTAFDESLTLDISKGGMGFVSAVRIPLNKQIVVQLDLTPDGEPVLVIGQVRWVSEMSDASGYRVGMSFKDVLSGSKSRLNQYFSKSL